ncbi:hypothetical protein WDU94_015404 [Cyamophila willieti]
MELTNNRIIRTVTYTPLNQASPKLSHNAICPNQIASNLPHNRTSTTLDTISANQTAFNSTSATIRSSDIRLKSKNIYRAAQQHLYQPNINHITIQQYLCQQPIPEPNVSNSSSKNYLSQSKRTHTSTQQHLLTEVIQPPNTHHLSASLLPSKPVVDPLDPLLIALFLPSRCQLISYCVLLVYTAVTFALVVLFDAFHPSTETEASTSELWLFLICQRLVIMCFFHAFF